MYEESTNLTSGYNLIVLNSSRKFLARPGDLIGFQSNGSAAPVQYAPISNTRGAYHLRKGGINVNITTAVHMNVSFSLNARGSVPRPTSVLVPGIPKVGVYILEVALENEVTPFPVVFQSLVVVQNPVVSMNCRDQYYIALDTSAEIEAQVVNGTNVTCKWQVTASNFEFVDAPHARSRLTEGSNCSLVKNFTRKGSTDIVLLAYNMVSSRRCKIAASVRETIAGLTPFLVCAAFAYQKAFTIMNASVVYGDHVRLSWIFSKSNWSVKPLGTPVGHPFTDLGDGKVHITANNTASIEKVDFSFRIIPNPLQIQIPSIVATHMSVKVVCNLTWPGGSPAEFFRQHNLTGQRGTHIDPSQAFMIFFGDGSSDQSNTGVFYHTFKNGLRNNKVLCLLKNNYEINTSLFILTLDPVVGLKVQSNCSSYVLVHQSCSFKAHVSKGNKLQYNWSLVEPSVNRSFSDKEFTYQFSALGLANLSLTVTNDVSSGQTCTLLNVVLYVPSEVTSIVPTSSTLSSSRLLSASAYSGMDTRTIETSSVSLYSEMDTRAIETPSVSLYSGIDTRATETSSVSSYSRLDASTPTPSPTVHSKSLSVAFPDIYKTGLRYPSFGVVGQMILFYVVNVKVSAVRYSWRWGDGLTSEYSHAAANHTYTEPGRYSFSVKISTTDSHVMLYGHVTVQFSIKGIQVEGVSLESGQVLRLRFKVAQGTNVSYSVNFGDGTGKQQNSRVIVTEMLKEV